MNPPAPIPTRYDGSMVDACLVQGGLVMARQVVSTAPLVGPTQVWATLSPDLQGRAVRLLAHLAWLCATAPRKQLSKESGDGIIRSSHQNSPRPS
jgi:hypothetical protein